MEPKIYTVEEVAKIVKMHKVTVYKRIKEEELIAVKLGENQDIRIKHEDLMNFINGGK